MKISAQAAYNALDVLAKGTERRKFSIPDITPHVRTAMTVLEGYRDTDGGKGIGMTDALNVALAAAYRPGSCSPRAGTSAWFGR